MQKDFVGTEGIMHYAGKLKAPGSRKDLGRYEQPSPRTAHRENVGVLVHFSKQT